MRLTGPSSVALGSTAAFTAILYKEDASTSDVSSLAEWSSSAPDVVRLNPSGIAVGITAGEGKVIAKYQQWEYALPVLVLPSGTFKLSGTVTESQAGFAQGIRGAAIEVVQGTGLGLRTTTTDYSGTFSLYGVAGDVQLNVTADSYETRLVNINVTRSTGVVIKLTPLETPPGTLSGRWTLTIRAPDCVFLPEAARSRQFVADITHTGSQRLIVNLSGQSLSHTEALIGQILGDTISLPFPYWPGDDDNFPFYTLIDSLQPKGFLGFRGLIRATFDGASASGVLEGAIDYFPNTMTTVGALPCTGPAMVSLQRSGQ